MNATTEANLLDLLLARDAAAGPFCADDFASEPEPSVPFDLEALFPAACQPDATTPCVLAWEARAMIRAGLL